MKFPSKRIPVIVALFALGTVLAVLTITHPEFLTANKVLNDFVAGDLLVLLVVPLTVIFASVASLHLQVSGMIRQVRRAEARERLEREFAKPLRDDVNSSAWLLFWTFVVCCVAIAVKGQWETNTYVVSAVHSIGIIAIAINAVVLYDVHDAIFALAPVLTGRNANDEGNDAAGGSGEG
jgi:hypothetical protein